MMARLGVMIVFITGNIIDISVAAARAETFSTGHVISPLSTSFSLCCGSYLYLLVNNL